MAQARVQAIANLDENAMHTTHLILHILVGTNLQQQTHTVGAPTRSGKCQRCVSALKFSRKIVTTEIPRDAQIKGEE